MSGAPDAQPTGGVRWALWLPLAIFLGFVVLVLYGLLRPASHDVASAMIGKPLPAFELPAAAADRPGLSHADFTDGKPKLLNIFASWCVPCAAEAPALAQLQARGVEIVGLAIHDNAADLDAFLQTNGNPYGSIGLDQGGKAQMAFGSAGVPETFVIDGTGKIVHQHIGMVTDSDVPMLQGLLEKAK